MRFSFAQPIPKALFAVLGEVYPRGLRYPELRERICEKLAMPLAELKLEDDAPLIQQIVSSFTNRVVELQVQPLAYAREVGARPRASALARLQAEMDLPVVTARLTNLALPDGLLRTLVPLLDGTRDAEGLLIELCVRAVPPESVTAEDLRRALEYLAASAVLTG